jgi:hypothetical protein
MRTHTFAKAHTAPSWAVHHAGRYSLLLIIFAAAGCGPISQQQGARQLPSEQEITTAATLPDDVAKTIDRLGSCARFSSELSEDQSKRDSEIISSMSELRCDSIEQEADARRFMGAN